jgi:hypothetical protein
MTCAASSLVRVLPASLHIRAPPRTVRTVRTVVPSPERADDYFSLHPRTDRTVRTVILDRKRADDFFSPPTAYRDRSSAQSGDEVSRCEEINSPAGLAPGNNRPDRPDRPTNR